MPFVSIPAKSALIRYSFHQGKNTTSIPFRIICYQDLMTSSNGLCPGVKSESVFLTLPMKNRLMPAAHAVTRGDGVEFRRFFFHYAVRNRAWQRDAHANMHFITY